MTTTKDAAKIFLRRFNYWRSFYQSAVRPPNASEDVPQPYRLNVAIPGTSVLMRAEGLEPPRAEAHQDLNLARMPIPPRPRGALERA